MRILAIRGCNLASLAGEFEIDLARGPLGGAGVFAIVGNTGAGKSTLLDALCVALFDRTPRLTNHSTVKVGRGDERALLGAQDVRTLLRRGAAQGWAEVDFESGDARQYRARWSVRRARGQSDGTLQDEQLSLTALTGGERLGGTKTETLKAIHARLGLSFDQFRRSALLAQGEFAAFLRADGKDRSELLERMTGTQIYSRLSIAAHVKAVLAEQRLREGRASALAIAVLDDAAAQVVQGELVAATSEAEAARRRHAEAEQLARWLAEAARRDRARAEAEAEHGAATAALVVAEPDRAELVLRRRAEQLRPAWDEVDRQARQLAGAAAELAAAGEAAAAAARRLDDVAARRSQVAAQHAPVRAARISAGLVERSAPRGGRVAVGAGALDGAAWLAAHAGLAPEVAAWAELDEHFAQRVAIGEAIAGLERALAGHAEARVKIHRAREVAAEEVRAAGRKHDEAKRKAAAYAHKRGLSLEAARRLEDEARVRLGEVERLGAIVEAARAAVAARDELDHQLAELAATAGADTAEHAHLGEVQRTQLALRAEQSRVVAELRRAADLAHARAELVAGEPCPLCGATEHPWRDRGVLDEVIAAAEGRLAATAGEIDAIAERLAAIAARDRQRAGDRARLAQQRAGAIAGAAAHAATWRERLGALGELLLVGDPASAAAQDIAADRQGQARAKLEAARATRHQTEAATKAASDAQAEVALAQVALDQLAAERTDLERRLAELDAAIGRVRGEHASKLEQRTTQSRAMAAAMARWLAALRAGSSGVAAAAGEAEARVAARARSAPGGSVRSVDGADARSAPAVRAGRDGAQTAVSQSVGRHGAHAGAALGVGEGDEISPSLAMELVAELQAVAPPRTAPVGPSSPLAIVRIALAGVVAAWRECADRVADADAALAAAAAEIERDARELERAVTEHAARRGAIEGRRDELVRAHADAAAELDARRSAAGFGPDELRRLLSGDASRVDALAERLAALERTLERTRAVVAERARRVAEHAAAYPAAERAAEPASDAASAAPVSDAAGAPIAADRRGPQLAPAPDVAALAAAVTAADRRVAQLAATLAADADARARRAAALAEVETDEAGAEIDRILGDVIGSHDGKLFRSFAQSLTLDSLLAVANEHLEELAPRYQLERVPRHDLELQVIDRDLGAEVRSVQSLSGGESFLVSLALALGLSSLSAHDVRVRTLLIDEGFGTLDPATLDSALSVLDALQATGRQVGVISHVPALVERVGAHVRIIQRGGGRSEVVVA